MKKTLLKFNFVFFLLLLLFIPFVVGANSNGISDPALISGSGANSAGILSSGLNAVLAGLSTIMLMLGGLIIFFGGLTFNAGIEWSILNFAKIAQTPGIALSWEVLRDIANIGLIFGFLAIGIATILGIQQYGAKTLLPKLIIVALLINFSFFFTTFVIDTSNIFASVILNQTGVTVACPDTSCRMENGLAGEFMQVFGLQSMLDIGAVGREISISTVGSTGKIFIAGIMGLLFFAVVGTVFISAGIILFYRMAKLLILIITSPVMFVAYILPNTQSYATKWWNSLLKESFVAPVLILMLVISLTFLNSAVNVFQVTSPGSTSSFIGVISGNTDSFSVLIIFIVAIILLLMSLQAAQAMGASGAKTAMGFAKRFATKKVAGAAAGSVGFAARSTIGAGAAALKRRSTAAASRIKGTGTLSRVARFGLRKTAESSDAVAKKDFDIRNTSVAQNLAKSAGIDIGKGGPGREKRIEAHSKRLTEFAKGFEDRDNTSEENDTLKEARIRTRERDEERNEKLAEIAQAQAQVLKKGGDPNKDINILALKDELKAIEKALEETRGNEKLLEKGIAAQKTIEGSTKKARQTEYARGLTAPKILTVSKESQEKAAKAILKEVNKSKDQKNLDTLAKALKSSANSGPSSNTSDEGKKSTS